jgi:hypothetical protein
MINIKHMNDSLQIPEQLEQVLAELSTYAGDLEDWMDVKKLLIGRLHPNIRSQFSRRDPKTKIPNFNKFEDGVVKRWEELTGVALNTDRCIRYDS